MNREPKGTPTGGQFAPGRKPEGGDLPVEPIMTPHGQLVINAFRADSGQVVALMGILTPCCNASGKGLYDEDADRGYVGCRRCFNPVDDIHGSCFSDEEFKDDTLTQAIADYWFDGDSEKVVGLRTVIAERMKDPS
jgi:hypothetical protein